MSRKSIIVRNEIQVCFVAIKNVARCDFERIIYPREYFEG
jgi:hypothetical protein